MGPITHGQASRYLDAMEVYRKPMDRSQIIGRIAVLMHHYYAPGTMDGVGEEQFWQWGELMEELPAVAFDAACKEWVRTKTRRPTPADILKMGKDISLPEFRDYYAIKEASKEPGRKCAMLTNVSINMHLYGKN